MSSSIPSRVFITASMGEIAVLLQIQYSETPEDIDKGGKAIQFGLTPLKALELAESLTKQAQRLLKDTPPGTSRH